MLGGRYTVKNCAKHSKFIPGKLEPGQMCATPGEACRRDSLRGCCLPCGAGAGERIRSLAARHVAAVREGDALLQRPRRRLRLRSRPALRKRLPAVPVSSSFSMQSQSASATCIDSILVPGMYEGGKEAQEAHPHMLKGGQTRHLTYVLLNTLCIFRSFRD